MSDIPLSSRDWFGKASAGLIPGFLLSLALSGLLYWAIGAGDSFQSVKGQVTMWAISPIWSLILAFCFLFRSPTRAWGVLGLASGLGWLALFATGALS